MKERRHTTWSVVFYIILNPTFLCEVWRYSLSLSFFTVCFSALFLPTSTCVMLDLAPISTSTSRGFLRKYGLLRFEPKNPHSFLVPKATCHILVISNISSQPHHPRKSIAHSGFQRWSSGILGPDKIWDSSSLLKSCPASSCRFVVHPNASHHLFPWGGGKKKPNMDIEWHFLKLRPPPKCLKL